VLLIPAHVWGSSWKVVESVMLRGLWPPAGLMSEQKPLQVPGVVPTLAPPAAPPALPHGDPFGSPIPHSEVTMTIMRTVTYTCAQLFTGYKVFHIHHFINSSQQPCEVGRAGDNVPICTDGETEAQRGPVTCSRPHSK
jgi:hypothetical protein